MRRMWLLVAIGVAAAVVGGCSDGRKEQAAPTGLSPVTSTTEPTFTGAGGGPFCAEVGALEGRLSELLASTDPDAARNLFTSAQKAVSSLADTAPAEIRGDMRVLVGVYRQLLDGLGRADFDMAKLGPDVAGRLDSPEARTAADRLDAYKRKVCQGGP